MQLRGTVVEADHRKRGSAHSQTKKSASHKWAELQRTLYEDAETAPVRSANCTRVTLYT